MSTATKVRGAVKVVQCKLCPDQYLETSEGRIRSIRPLTPHKDWRTGLALEGTCPKHPRGSA